MFRLFRRSTVMFAASLCAAVCVAQAASAQVARMFVPATTLAPIVNRLPADLRIDVLTVVPHNALALVTAHHILDTKSEVESLLSRLEVPFDRGEGYAQFTTFLEGIEGWDEKSTHALAFLPVAEQGEPKVAVFVPVTNYKEFARSLGADPDAEGPTEFSIEDGPNGLMAAKNNYAVLVEAGNGEVLAAVLASNQSLAASCEPIRKWIGDHPMSGAVTTAGIQFAVDAMLQSLEEAKGIVPDEPGARVVMKVFMPMVETALRTVREEMTHLVAAPSLDTERGLALSSRAVFKSGGRYAAAVADLPTLPADHLKYLPQNGLVAASSFAYPELMTDDLIELAMTVLKELQNEDALPFDVEPLKPLLEKAREASRGVKYATQASTVGVGDGFYDGMAGLYVVEDAASFVTKQRGVVEEAIAVVRKSVPQAFPAIPIEDANIDGAKGFVIRLDVLELIEAFDPDALQDEAGRISIEAMTGADGKMSMYFVAVDATHAVYAFSKEALDIVVNNIRNNRPGLADDVMVKKTAALLPADLTATAYIDVGGYFEMVKSMMVKMMAAQGNAGGVGGFVQFIPAFPKAPPFGYSLKVAPTAVDLDMVIPLELMETTRDYAKQVTAMFGGGAAGGLR